MNGFFQYRKQRTVSWSSISSKTVDIRHGQCYNVDNQNEAKGIFSLRVRWENTEQQMHRQQWRSVLGDSAPCVGSIKEMRWVRWNPIMCPPMTMDRGIPVRGRDIILLNSKNRDPNSGKCMSGLILMYCSSHWVQPAIQSGSDSFWFKTGSSDCTCPGRFQAKRVVSGLIRQILVLENAEIRKDASGHVLREVK